MEKQKWPHAKLAQGAKKSECGHEGKSNSKSVSGGARKDRREKRAQGTTYSMKFIENGREDSVRMLAEVIVRGVEKVSVGVG